VRVFENRVLRRISELKGDMGIGGWRQLHNEELHNLYSLSSIIRIISSWMMRWAGHVSQIWEKRNACNILVRKPNGRDQ
jgi:hypothetical protein